MKKWASGICRRHSDLSPAALTALVANRVAEALDVPPVGPLIVESHTTADWPVPPDGWADPWLVGLVHEQSASSTDRKARGAWYTPKAVVAGIVRLATADGRCPNRLVDPTCGGGAFLLAGLDRLVELGVEPEAAVARVAGIDVDPVAAEVSRWSVQLWLGAKLRADGAEVDDLAAAAVDVRCADALAGWPEAWSRPLVVAGNPPFASPLKRGAVPALAAERRAERSDLLGPYADIAAVHLLDAVERAGAGSTVALVQPQSILASRDTEALRADLDERAPLAALWVAREQVFDAGVRACAPVLHVADGGRRTGRVSVAAGREVTVRAERPHQSWGNLAADALGAPTIPMLEGRLGELVSATAGFRDEHYGLVSVCREAEPFEREGDGTETARLVTVGSVDPLSLAWGRSPTRFGGRTWDRPIVTRTGLPPRVARWFDAQLRPKVLLATQSKLLEPVVDRSGDLMPATPLIAVHADPADLDHVAAVLLAPPVVLWAWRRWFGTALTVDAVKLAARHVAELPVPVDRDAWDEAAAVVASVLPSTRGESGVVGTADGANREPDETVAKVGELMNDAYGASPDVFDWWFERLTGTRGGPPTKKGSLKRS